MRQRGVPAPDSDPHDRMASDAGLQALSSSLVFIEDRGLTPGFTRHESSLRECSRATHCWAAAPTVAALWSSTLESHIPPFRPSRPDARAANAPPLALSPRRPREV